MRRGAAKDRDDGRSVDTPSPVPDDEIDETLIDLMLEQSISDRLRSLSNYVNALARLRPI